MYYILDEWECVREIKIVRLLFPLYSVEVK
jgi:hypothetical protein